MLMPYQFRRYLESGAVHEPPHYDEFLTGALASLEAEGGALNLWLIQQREALIWAYHPDAWSYDIELGAINNITTVLESLLALADGVEWVAQGVAIMVEIAILSGIGAAVVISLAPLIALIEAGGAMAGHVKTAIEAILYLLGIRNESLASAIAELNSLLLQMRPFNELGWWNSWPIPEQEASLRGIAVAAFVVGAPRRLIEYQEKINNVIDGAPGDARGALAWAAGRTHIFWRLEAWRGFQLIHNRP